MLTLHHLENSQSLRILWLLEELQADYKIQCYRRDSHTSLAPSAFKKLHPIGTSPCISDDELVLPETNAIMDHLLDKYDTGTTTSSLRPNADDPRRSQYLYWFHAAQGSFMPLLLDALIFKRMVSKVPFFLRPVIGVVVNKVKAAYLTPRLNKLLAHIEHTLSQSKWFAGDDFSAADIVMGYCMEVADVRVGMNHQYPNAQRFLQQIRARPAYQSAIKKGGAFQPLAE